MLSAQSLQPPVLPRRGMVGLESQLRTVHSLAKVTRQALLVVCTGVSIRHSDWSCELTPLPPRRTGGVCGFAVAHLNSRIRRCNADLRISVLPMWWRAWRSKLQASRKAPQATQWCMRGGTSSGNHFDITVLKSKFELYCRRHTIGWHKCVILCT